MKQTIDYKKIKDAAGILLRLSEAQRNNFLEALSKIVLLQKQNIIDANKKDILEAKKQKLDEVFVQRLVVTEKQTKEMVQKIAEVKRLKSPVGKTLLEKKLKSGIFLKKISVPLGVIMVIYESRPEVTIDVAALCIKSGNAVVLKGGSEAINTNTQLYSCIAMALEAVGIVKDAVTFISRNDRKYIASLLKKDQYIDLVIARGGYGLVKAVMKQATMPVLAHAAGGARIYVDKTADLKQAMKIITNAKISKP